MTSVDIRQSVTAILDDNLQIMQGYEYDEFGNQTISGNSTFLNEVTFTGAIADSTGLYYMNARFYNSNTGGMLGRAINSAEFMTSQFPITGYLHW